jgi:hypothetical protein
VKEEQPTYLVYFICIKKLVLSAAMVKEAGRKHTSRRWFVSRLVV